MTEIIAVSEGPQGQSVSKAPVLAPNQIATRLIQAAARMRQLDRPESEYALLRQAIGLIPHASALRRVLALAQERLDIDAALVAHRGLLEVLRDQPAEQARTDYARLCASELTALDLLARLPAGVDPGLGPVDPVPGRLLYILHHSRPYLSNGYATRGHGLATGMQEAGIDLFCMTMPGFPMDVKADLPQGAAEDTVEAITYLRNPTPRRFGPDRSLLYLQESAAVMEQRIRALRPQAIIVASNYVAALPALMAARRCGVPLAYEVRGFWEITDISREPDLAETFSHQLRIRIESELAAGMDQIFTLSVPMAEVLVRRGAAPARIALLQNACDPEKFMPHARDDALAATWNLPQGVPVIGYIGSFVQYEGLDDLTRACAMLRKQGYSFRLVLVGNEKAAGNDRGPITQLVTRTAEEEGLTDWLIMPGRVPHEDVERWYSLIDIAPFPRKSQAVTELVTPLKPLEALAMEKAVVVSSVRAMAEMVEDGQTGLVFEKDNVADLTRTLALLIDDPALRNSLGEAGRRWVQADRTWRHMGDRVKSWLQGQEVR